MWRLLKSEKFVSSVKYAELENLLRAEELISQKYSSLGTIVVIWSRMQDLSYIGRYNLHFPVC